MDPRREAAHVATEFSRYHSMIGEAITWFCFDQVASQYDSVYDEGYRKYEAGRKIPVLWVDQQEAAEDYSPEGRRPTQRLRFAVGARQLHEAGIAITEAHGERLSDTPVSGIWRDDRLNDIVFYDGRFYEISNFQIRGRLQGEDVIIGVSCIETKSADELNLDLVPTGWFPAALPPESTDSLDTTYGQTPPADPTVGDIWIPEGV